MTTALGQPFWDAARQRRLVRPVCDSCDASHFPPLPACPACWAPTWTWTESPGTGTVHSWTRLHRAPGPGFTTPYVLADVDLDDGWNMMTNIVGAAEVTVGMRVSVTWLEVADGAVLPVFGPSTSEEVRP